jgi:hypothetical protein
MSCSVWLRESSFFGFRLSWSQKWLAIVEWSLVFVGDCLDVFWKLEFVSIWGSSFLSRNGTGGSVSRWMVPWDGSWWSNSGLRGTSEFSLRICGTIFLCCVVWSVLVLFVSIFFCFGSELRSGSSLKVLLFVSRMGEVCSAFCCWEAGLCSWFFKWSWGDHWIVLLQSVSDGISKSWAD